MYRNCKEKKILAYINTFLQAEEHKDSDLMS